MCSHLLLSYLAVLDFGYQISNEVFPLRLAFEAAKYYQTQANETAIYGAIFSRSGNPLMTYRATFSLVNPECLFRKDSV